MKKTIFVCLSVIVGLIAFFFTFIAAAIEPQEGFGLVEVLLLSYCGVIVPNIALEVAKFLCFKHDYKKIYASDIISALICLFPIIIINLIYLGGMNFLEVFKQEFFLYQFPWIITFLAYIVLLLFKSKKAR